VAVFVDGCFWHGCPDHFIEPKTRADFWLDKIRGNRQRDDDTRQQLEQSGATVIRIWEHQDPNQAADEIEAVYRSIQGSEPATL
jgi:DNA mismatch endonuclease (patch repair protein)